MAAQSSSRKEIVEILAIEGDAVSAEAAPVVRAQGLAAALVGI
jgi:hypothetical protein